MQRDWDCLAFWRFVLKSAFWALVCIAVYVCLEPEPPQIPGVTNDLIYHFGGWIGLTMLGGVAYWRLPAAWLLFGSAMLNLAIEFAQALLPFGRDGDPMDWIAGLAGSLCAISILIALKLVFARSARRKLG